MRTSDTEMFGTRERRIESSIYTPAKERGSGASAHVQQHSELIDLRQFSTFVESSIPPRAALSNGRAKYGPGGPPPAVIARLLSCSGPRRTKGFDRTTEAGPEQELTGILDLSRLFN
jgi:hypothetical protein